MTAIDWPVPATKPALNTDEVHLWCIQLDQPAPVITALEQTLAPDEQARAARFVFAQHRTRFIVGRASLRAILGHYVATTPTALQFTYNTYGKPALAAPDQQDLSFNLSHTEGLALCAITQQRLIGVDIEAQRPLQDMFALARTVFAANEYATLCRLPAHQQNSAFFQAWTRKEAFIKAIGEGLSYPLQRFEVSLTPDVPCQLLSIAGDAQQARQWTLAAFLPATDYPAAAAVQGTDLQFSCWQWPVAVDAG